MVDPGGSTSARGVRGLLAGLCLSACPSPQQQQQQHLRWQQEDAYACSDAAIQQGPLSDDILLLVIRSFANKQDAATSMRGVCRMWRRAFDGTVRRVVIHGSWAGAGPRHSALPLFPLLRSASLDHGHLSTLADLVLPMVARCGRLHTLQCSHNTLTALPAAICDLPGLQHLVVAHTALASVPPRLHLLPRLQALVLRDGRLAQVPATLGSIGTLTALDLSGNQLTCLPEALGGLTALRELVLRDNLLETLPDGISDLGALTSLNLSSNRLRALPPGMSRLQQLRSLGVFAAFSHPMNENNDTVKVLAALKLHCPGLHLMADEVLSTLVRHRAKRLRAAEEAAAAQGHPAGAGGGGGRGGLLRLPLIPGPGLPQLVLLS